jgi:adenosylcobinamide-GDP ribazoletransferase
VKRSKAFIHHSLFTFHALPFTIHFSPFTPCTDFTMRLYLIALQFLTIIPLPFTVRCQERDLGRSMSLFPLVGVTLGLILMGTNYLLNLLLPRSVTDLLLLGLLAGLTGALHLDGLADVFDGLAARGGRERFLAVMKDSRSGPVGAAALAFFLLLKYQALLAVPDPQKYAALLLFPLLGRYAQVQCTVGATRARSDGLGSTFIGGAGTFQLLAALAITLTLSIFLLGVNGVWLCAGVCLLTWWLRRWAHNRLGGITGDIIGFTCELTETAALLLIVALCRPENTILQGLQWHPF